MFGSYLTFLDLLNYVFHHTFAYSEPALTFYLSTIDTYDFIVHLSQTQSFLNRSRVRSRSRTRFEE